jgi:hypothetical protein
MGCRPEVCVLGLVARPLTPPGGVRSAICRIAESSEVTFDEIAWGLHQLAQARKGRGQEARGRCASGFSSHGRGPRRQGEQRASGHSPQ